MKKTAILLALAGLTLAGAAGASTITFSESGAANTEFFSDDGLIKAEYVWSIGVADGHSHLATVAGNTFEQGHGQPYQGMRFSRVGGGELILNSFDFQGSWTVNGLNNGNGTVYSTAFGNWVTQSINLRSDGAIYIFAGDNWTSGYLDNVVFNEAATDVPEPASAALMLLGMAGLATLRRKAGKQG